MDENGNINIPSQQRRWNIPVRFNIEMEIFECIQLELKAQGWSKLNKKKGRELKTL